MTFKPAGKSLCVLIAVFLFAGVSGASVIVRIPFEQVVKGAELIIHGSVLSAETRVSPISGKPFTYFTIRIDEIIKGDYPFETIEIGYMGGTIGEMTLEVSDMRMPRVDERGIYFIETLGAQQIHPLIGWQQGHYRVIVNQDTGREVVVSQQPAESTPRGMMAPQGIGVEEFKQTIRNLMD